MFLVEGIVIFTNNTSSIELTNVLQIQLWIIFFGWFVHFFRKFGIGNIFTLFLLCLSLFNFQKFLWDPVLGTNFRYAQSLIQINLPEDVVHKTLFIYGIFTYFICFFYSVLTKSKPSTISNELKPDKKLFRVGKLLFILFLGIALYRSYLEFSALAGKMYAEYYTEEGGADIPSIVRLGSIFFQVSFMIILASIPSKKNFLIFGGLFLAVMIPNLFSGLRATFAVTFLYLVWYYYNVYKEKFNLVKLGLGFLGLILLFQIIAERRSNSSNNLNAIESISSFFYLQSQSMYVLALYIQYEDEIVPHNYPYILDPIISWMFPSGQSEEVIMKRSAINHQLTYTLNPNYYLSGASLGTNFIAELYEFGIFGIIIGAFLFALFISKFSNNVLRNRYLLFLSLIIVSYFLIAPRSTFLPSFYFIVRCTLIYLLILMLFRFKIRNYIKWK